MKNIKNLPKNCNECEYTNSCMGYYGGISCQYEKEISQTAIVKFWTFIEKNLNK